MRHRYWKDAGRLVCLFLICLLVLVVFHNNMVKPETRGVAILGFATVISVILGHEL